MMIVCLITKKISHWSSVKFFAATAPELLGLKIVLSYKHTQRKVRTHCVLCINNYIVKKNNNNKNMERFLLLFWHFFLVNSFFDCRAEHNSFCHLIFYLAHDGGYQFDYTQTQTPSYKRSKNYSKQQLLLFLLFCRFVCNKQKSLERLVFFFCFCFIHLHNLKILSLLVAH